MFAYTREWETHWTPPRETGSLFHACLRMHFAGGSADAPIGEYLAKAEMEAGSAKELTEAHGAAKRAKALVSHYISAYIDYEPLASELDIQLGAHHAIIDLVAIYKGALSLFDFKTTAKPDLRKYDISGQLDYYAWLYRERFRKDVALIVYDIASEAGFVRQERAPNLELGFYLGARMAELAGRLSDGYLPFDYPSYSTNCYSCDFLEACHMATHDSMEASTDYLANAHVKRALTT